MDRDEGTGWAALAVRELGRASYEVAEGLRRDDAGATLSHVQTARSAVEKALHHLTIAEAYLATREPGR